jgi:tetratricopeptide (TPR) repeat protein
MTPNYSPHLRAWIGGGVRVVLLTSFWLNYRWFGQEPYTYHLVNVVLHILDGVVVFFIVRRILEWAKTEARLAAVLSAFAAGVFLLHPLQTESVAYVASRSEVLSVLLLNTALVIFLYRRAASISIGTAAAVLVCFGLATLTKEHTVVLPLVLLLTDFFWNPGFRFEGIRRNWKLYLPILLVGGGAGAYALKIVRESTSAGAVVKDFTWVQYFLTQGRVIWTYLRLFVIPFGQNLDPDIPVSRSNADPLALLGLAALAAATVAAWYFRKKYSVGAFGWFVFLILLAPTSSLIPLADVYAERRTYLPFLGLLLITVELLRHWKAERKVLMTALTVVLLVEAGLTYQRNQLWGNAIDLWRETAAKSPNKIRPNFQFAKALSDAAQYPEAVAQYERTARIKPPDYPLLVDWALALQGERQYAQAAEKLTQAAAMHPTAHIDSELAKEYALQNNFDLALVWLDKAQKLNPNYDMTYVYRGMTYQSMGDAQRAEAEYRHALQLNPRNPLTPGLLQNLPRRR